MRARLRGDGWQGVGPGRPALVPFEASTQKRPDAPRLSFHDMTSRVSALERGRSSARHREAREADEDPGRRDDPVPGRGRGLDLLHRARTLPGGHRKAAEHRHRGRALGRGLLRRSRLRARQAAAGLRLCADRVLATRTRQAEPAHGHVGPRRRRDGRAATPI